MATKKQTETTTPTKKKMGRPRKEIAQDQFEKLCGLMCTKAEIAGWFKCSEDTIENWCKRTYGSTFSAAFKEHSADGKISLRRYQFELAKKSAAMAIFLGKNYLGQRDVVEQNSNVNVLSQASDILSGVNTVIGNEADGTSGTPQPLPDDQGTSDTSGG